MAASSSSGNVENVSTRLKKLEDIEKKITAAIKVAGTTLEELSKEKPADKTVEKHAGHFLQFMEEIENELSSQIVYLSQAATIHQHEGSSYANLKRVQLVNAAIGNLTNQIHDLALILEVSQVSHPK